MRSFLSITSWRKVACLFTALVVMQGYTGTMVAQQDRGTFANDQHSALKALVRSALRAGRQAKASRRDSDSDKCGTCPTVYCDKDTDLDRIQACLEEIKSLLGEGKDCECDCDCDTTVFDLLEEILHKVCALNTDEILEKLCIIKDILCECRNGTICSKLDEVADSLCKVKKKVWTVSAKVCGIEEKVCEINSKIDKFECCNGASTCHEDLCDDSYRVIGKPSSCKPSCDYSAKPSSSCGTEYTDVCNRVESKIDDIGSDTSKTRKKVCKIEDRLEEIYTKVDGIGCKCSYSHTEKPSYNSYDSDKCSSKDCATQEKLCKVGEDVLGNREVIGETLNKVCKVDKNVANVTKKVCSIDEKINALCSKIESCDGGYYGKDSDYCYGSKDSCKESCGKCCPNLCEIDSKLDTIVDCTQTIKTEVEEGFQETHSKLACIKTTVCEIHKEIKDLDDSRLDKICEIQEQVEELSEDLECHHIQLVTHDLKTEQYHHALLKKVCIIDSKVDEIDMNLSVTIIGEMLLEPLEQKICDVDSKVDILDSKIDFAISKVCIIDSKVDELSEDFQETWTVLDCIKQKVCIIDSKVDEIAQDIKETWTLIGDACAQVNDDPSNVIDVNAAKFSVIEWLKLIYNKCQ